MQGLLYQVSKVYKMTKTCRLVVLSDLANDDKLYNVIMFEQYSMCYTSN